MATTKQQLIGAAGVGLIAANFWTGSNKAAIGVLTKGDATSDQITASHAALKAIGLEVLFVAVAVLIGGASNQLGTAMLTMIVALFVVWAITHFAKKS